MPNRNKSSLIASCFLPAIALMLLGLIYGLAQVASIPRRAVEIFGPASPRLSTIERFRLSAMLVWQADELTRPSQPFGQSQSFDIASGESIPSITQRLMQAGLIGSPSAFRSYLQYSGLDILIQAGSYSLSPGMTPLEIAQTLQDATPTQVTFVVLAGWRLEEIAGALPTSGLSITPQEFINTAYQPHPGHDFSSLIPSGSSVEGFLYPDAYVVERDISAAELIDMMLDRFDNQLSQEVRTGFNRQHLDLYEAVILASMIQREAILDEEQPTIASVFYNRLAAGMNLASDPTVQYAIGYNPEQQTWWTNPLTAQDLQIDSPFNTYIYPDLPPGPIANPGPSALRAAAFPAQTPYYYFRAACDGSNRHSFAATYQEHLDNACP